MGDTPSKQEQAEEIKAKGAPDDANVGAGLPSAAERRAASSSDDEDTFTVERLLGPGGLEIAQASVRKVSRVHRHALAGAFHDLEPDDELTRAEVRERVEGFYAHQDTTGQED
jgi:hypothetical protein